MFNNYTRSLIINPLLGAKNRNTNTLNHDEKVNLWKMLQKYK